VQIADASVIRLGIHALQLDHALHVGDEVALLTFQSIADRGGDIINSQAGAAPTDPV
jgi:hypothetical protein